MLGVEPCVTAGCLGVTVPSSCHPPAPRPGGIALASHELPLITRSVALLHPKPACSSVLGIGLCAPLQREVAAQGSAARGKCAWRCLLGPRLLLPVVSLQRQPFHPEKTAPAIKFTKIWPAKKPFERNHNIHLVGKAFLKRTKQEIWLNYQWSFISRLVGVSTRLIY